MSKKYIIALDQGTTSTRTIIFDLKGAIQGISQKELLWCESLEKISPGSQCRNN